MIKVISFPVQDYEKANAFMAEHPPRSTENQSGIVFHEGNIVIVYEDGTHNEIHEKEVVLRQLDHSQRNKILVNHKIIMANKALDRIKPAGYVFGMPNTQIEKLLTEQGLDYKTSKSVLDQIVNLENEIKMNTHEFERVGYEIDAYEEELKAYESNKE